MTLLLHLSAGSSGGQISTQGMSAEANVIIFPALVLMNKFKKSSMLVLSLQYRNLMGISGEHPNMVSAGQRVPSKTSQKGIFPQNVKTFASYKDRSCLV
jgi:hypothetical protein